ncbi:MAG: glycosyltransferase family 2 protein, partial [Anaeromassilibacillus sp.]
MIVPVYNVEDYLEQCVKSIVPTLEDIEVLLVNDADGRVVTLLALKRTSGCVMEKPTAVRDTRNYGVARATGEYLAFIDSDDWVDPEMLETVYAAAKEQEADLVVFNYMRENLIDGESRACSVPLQAGESDEERNRALLEELIGPSVSGSSWRTTEMLGCAWRRLYRRAWFVENHLAYFNEQEIMLEDLPVSIMAHTLAKKIVFAKGAYYHYR